MLPLRIRESLDDGDIQDIWTYIPHTDQDVMGKQSLRVGLRYVLGYNLYPPESLTSPMLRRILQGVFFWLIDTRANGDLQDPMVGSMLKEVLFNDKGDNDEEQ